MITIIERFAAPLPLKGYVPADIVMHRVKSRSQFNGGTETHSRVFKYVFADDALIKGDVPPEVPLRAMALIDHEKCTSGDTAVKHWTWFDIIES